MKKRVAAVALAVALLLTTAGCSAARAGRALDRAGERAENGLDAIEDTMENAVRRMMPEPSGDPVPGETEATGTTITAAQAENIALKHVEFSADQVQRMHTEYEIENGVPQYDVEFHKDGVEYEFKIHAQTGDIMSYDTDPDHD